MPGVLLLAWRKRRDARTQFLIAWIVLFFGASLVVFFAGSARYLLPMVAPVAMLASGIAAALAGRRIRAANDVQPRAGSDELSALGWLPGVCGVARPGPAKSARVRG